MILSYGDRRTADFAASWINLQAQYEIAVARQRVGEEIARLPLRKIA